MADFNSKYTGEEVEQLLDQVANGEVGGGETLTEADIANMGFTKNQGTITELKMNGVSKGTSGVVDLGTVITEHQDISGKQDTIEDLDAIREGASKGATALQSVPDEYITNTELEGKGYAEAIDLDGKVDKVTGKGLSTEDFTAALKSKLEGLSNYDDTEISNAVASLQSQIDTLVGGNATSAIDSFNEIIAFLNGITDSEDLDSIIASIEQQIASKQDKIEGLDDINAKLEVIDGIVDADGYLYSNGEKVDMRFTRSLLPVGTAIPANVNLNTIQYLKIGKYYCSLNVDAETITNCPVNVAFSMEVFNPLGTNVDDETTKEYTYRLRVLTQYDSGMQYMQFCKTSGTAGSWTYGDWYAAPRTKATLNSNKHGSTLTLGSATQGVYVNSTGVLTKMTYTLGKSVPSSAVFTDTNTKVTSVSNHYAPAEDDSVALNAPDGEVIVGLKRDAAGHIVGIETTQYAGGGGGGITVETDPVFSASPAATITEEKITVWNDAADLVGPLDQDIAQLYSDLANKQDAITDLETIREGAAKGATAVQSKDVAGIVTEEGFVAAEDLAKVATSGSYNDLVDKPTIPSAVTESTVSGWGFTKNTGTYSKPSTGIPASDLASDVRASLSNADNAVQKDMVGTLNIINVDGVNDGEYVYALPTAAAKNANKDYDDIILSRGSVKTINGESIVGSGNITIEGGGSGSGGGGKEYVIVEPILSPMGSEAVLSNINPNKVYVVSDSITSLVVSSFVTTTNVADDYDIIFKTDFESYLSFPVDLNIIWANGASPVLEMNTMYELSIKRVTLGFTVFYNAVLTPFKSV